MRLLSWLPLSLVIALATGLGWLFARLPFSVARPCRVALINTLACFPDKDWQQATAFARRVFVETARTLAGYSHIWLRPVTETLARIEHIEGEAAWHAALADSRPILYLSLHQSSWELSVLAVGQHDPAMLVMYQPVGNSALEDLVNAGRAATGCSMIPTNGEGVKKALSAMAKGGSMALLADHKPSSSSNPYASFFGHQVLAPAFVNKVIQRYRPHVFYVSAMRLPGYRFRINIEPAADDLVGQSETAVLNSMMAAFERIIRRQPEQYQWTYKRFKRGPNGRRDWYRHAPALLQRIRNGEPVDQVLID